MAPATLATPSGSRNATSGLSPAPSRVDPSTARRCRRRRCDLEAPMTVEGATASFDGGPKRPRCSLPALAVMLALASVALATDHPIAGDSLALKDPMAASDRKVRFKATRDAAIDPSEAGDPRALGATL